MSVAVIGGIEELKFFEKRRLSSVALEEADVVEVSSPITNVGMELEPLLSNLPKVLTRGLESTKNLVSETLITALFRLLYSGARDGDMFDLPERAIFFLTSLDNHGRFHLLGSVALGIHLCMISRKALHQLFQEILGLVINKDVRGVKGGEKFIC